MKTEAIGAEDVTDGTADVRRRRKKIEGQRRGSFWVALVLAAIPTVLLTWLGFHLGDLPEQIAGVVFFAVILPTAAICETLGFGHFSIFGGNTIPDWLFFSVMIVMVYVSNLVSVLVGRFVVRLVGLRGAGR